MNAIFGGHRPPQKSNKLLALQVTQWLLNDGMAKFGKTGGGLTARNPDRTRERILSAASKEFAARGFAGARVDAIARRAAINKRMLYHYFGDKEGLFKSVLRRKVAERRAWGGNLSSDPAERLPFWFKTACDDPDWIRLLEWEALQSDGKKVIDEDERRVLSVEGIKRLCQRQ